MEMEDLERCTTAVLPKKQYFTGNRCPLFPGEYTAVQTKPDVTAPVTPEHDHTLEKKPNS